MHVPYKNEKAPSSNKKNAKNRVAYEQNLLTLDINAVRRMEFEWMNEWMNLKESGAAESSSFAGPL